MKKIIVLLTGTVVLALLNMHCSKEKIQPTFNPNPVLPSEPYDYTYKNVPDHMRAALLSGFFGDTNIIIDPFPGGFNKNPQITNPGAALGRVLFYDRNLSVNNKISCGSCHHQALAFADGQASSAGFEGKRTPRNAMSIVNVAMNNNLFWDSRAQSVQELTLKPVQNHIEMGMEHIEVLKKKLASIDYYPPLFQKAFDSPVITEDKISLALTQFLCSMVSVNSKFDDAIIHNSTFANFTDLEKLGKDLFFSSKTKCAECHNGLNFAAPDSPFGGEYGDPDIAGTSNTGLDPYTHDAGKGGGQFRIPSLRNVGYTAPYMHDGRFKTIDEVIEFYNSGIQDHANLDPKLRGADGKPRKMNLTGIEKAALKAFLHTLNDRSIQTDPRFSNPFPN